MVSVSGIKVGPRVVADVNSLRKQVNVGDLTITIGFGGYIIL